MLIKHVHFIFCLCVIQQVYGQNPTPNKYEIYSYVLGEHIRGISESGEIKTIVFGRKTDYLSLGGNDSDSLIYSLVEKLKAKPKRISLNPSKVNSPVRIKGISRLKINIIFRGEVEKGWERFYRKYPSSSGIITLSDIVYSKDYKYCLFIMGYQRGARHGGGELFLIDLRDKPKIMEEIGLWRS